MTRKQKAEYLHLLDLYVSLADEADSLQAFNGPDIVFHNPINYCSRFERDVTDPETPEAGYYRRSFHVFNGIYLLAEAAGAEVFTSKPTDPSFYDVHYFAYKGVCFYSCDLASRKLADVIEEVPK